MPHIEVDSETADRLSAQAAARGVSAGEYLRSLVPRLLTSGVADVSIDTLDAELEHLTLKLPTLPADFRKRTFTTITIDALLAPHRRSLADVRRVRLASPGNT